MRRPLSFLLTLLASTIAASASVYLVVLRPMQRAWGIRPEEQELPLSGDEVVLDPVIVDTRGIDIAAPPAEIWPWLVQMGFGRAGWYSYDRLDAPGPSAEGIVPELQQLAVGDIVPTWPGGGFRVAAIEPDVSLVLYLDDEMVAAQAAKAEPTGEASQAGLKAAGGMGRTAMPAFKASWAFVLRPIDGERTRLIERFRVWTPAPTRSQRVALPLMGVGVFLMTRRQMLGIRDRAERPTTKPAGAPPWSAEPASAPEPEVAAV